jgi:predicted nuclease of predicted toxin-antitoxin system
VKLLIDECLSARLCDLLAKVGHDVLHASDLGLLGAPDTEVMAAAVETDRILVSADTDFGELLAKSGSSLPSVVLIRRPGKTPEEQANVLKANLPTVDSELSSGAAVVILPDRVRVRRLPIGTTK